MPPAPGVLCAEGDLVADFRDGLLCEPIEHRRIATHRCAVPFVTLWRDSTTASRVALLLTAEQALEHDASALDPVVGGLLPLLSSDDTALRGDQLDEAAALAAQQAAEKALEGASEETDVARAQAELAEARARYRAAQKLKGKR